MIRQLLYKWLGLEEPSCQTCEVLRAQLESCNNERKELLSKLLNKDIPKEAESHEIFQPITPQYVPWRVKLQMLEKEDREKARIMREKAVELAEVQPVIEKLEKELGVVENG